MWLIFNDWNFYSSNMSEFGIGTTISGHVRGLQKHPAISRWSNRVGTTTVHNTSACFAALQEFSHYFTPLYPEQDSCIIELWVWLMKYKNSRNVFNSLEAGSKASWSFETKPALTKLQKEADRTLNNLISVSNARWKHTEGKRNFTGVLCLIVVTLEYNSWAAHITIYSVKKGHTFMN